MGMRQKRGVDETRVFPFFASPLVGEAARSAGEGFGF